MDEQLADTLLTLGVALIGVGGTIAVTIVQLRARRKELDDDRVERERQEAKRNRDAVAHAVLTATSRLSLANMEIAAGVWTEHSPGAREVGLVFILIRLHLPHEEAESLVRWWRFRESQIVMATGKSDVWAKLVEEITQWHDGTLTAAAMEARVAAEDVPQ